MKTIRIHLLLFFCLSSIPQLAAQEIADKVYDAIRTGTTQQAFEGLKEAYESFGVEFNDLLRVEEQESTIMLSYYDNANEKIVLSRMVEPGGGKAYWKNWSNLMADGGWDIDKEFKNEAEMDLMANYAIMGILAHEIGHYVCEHYDWNRYFCYDETKADELAVHIMNFLASNKKMRKLRDRYKELVTESLYNAGTADVRVDFGAHSVASVADLEAFCETFEMPDGAGYVSFQILRQNRMLSFDELKDHAALKAEIRAHNTMRREHTIYAEIPMKLINGPSLASIDLMAMLNQSFGVDMEGTPYEVLDINADAQMITANNMRTGKPFFAHTLTAITGSTHYTPKQLLDLQFIDSGSVVVLMNKTTTPTSDVVVPTLYVAEERDGELLSYAYPLDAKDLILKASIIHISENRVVFASSVINSETKKITSRISELNLLTKEVEVRLSEEPGTGNIPTTDGEMTVGTSRNLITKVHQVLDDSYVFAQGDVLKIVNGGTMRTLAGNRSGTGTNVQGNAFWKPLILGTDANGTLHVLCRKLFDGKDMASGYYVKQIQFE